MMVDPDNMVHTTSSVVRQLVAHYKQSVHVVEEKPPYFDSLLGYPPPIPPILRFCLERLVEKPAPEVLELLNGYSITIRPLYEGETETGWVPVLQNYELLLSQWLAHLNDNVADVSTGSSLNDGVATLSKTLDVLSLDVTRLTSSSEAHISQYVRCNVVISCLLRIIQHCVSAAMLLFGKDHGLERNDSMIRCLVCLLAFGERHQLTAITVAPYLIRERNRQVDRFCVFPPPDVDKDAWCEFLSLELVGWGSIRLGDEGWNDPVTNIATRVSQDVWKCIGKAIQMETGDVDPMQPIQIIRYIGMARVAQAVSSHFAGHDSSNVRDMGEPLHQVIMGRRTVATKPSLEDKPFKVAPSRLYVAMNFVRQIDELDKDMTRDIVDACIPICLELLDSTVSLHASLGSSALLQLLEVLDTDEACWGQYSEDVFSKLETAVDVHREGPTLVTLGRVQSRYMQIVRQSQKVLRLAIGKWLRLLQQSSNRPKTGYPVWELLVGGVIPLLYQLALRPNAEGIEIGRLGLSALLPLISGEFVDSRTQGTAMIALINLAVSAYPIMPHHGGKAMCNVVASFTRWTDDANLQEDYFKDLAIHTAAVTLVLGRRRAQEVLDEIYGDRASYKGTFLTSIDTVRELGAGYARKDFS